MADTRLGREVGLKVLLGGLASPFDLVVVQGWAEEMKSRLAAAK